LDREAVNLSASSPLAGHAREPWVCLGRAGDPPLLELVEFAS
jgi:hypothetical protein